MKIKNKIQYPKQETAMMSAVDLKPMESYNTPPNIGAIIYPIEKKVLYNPDAKSLIIES